jgi:hypothetical protein
MKRDRKEAMYAIHLGIASLGVPVRVEDESQGKVVVFNKLAWEEPISLETAGEMHYIAEVQTDSFRAWKDNFNKDDAPMHVVVRTSGRPLVREVHHIREALKTHILTGRILDYAIVTNDENWDQKVAIFLWEATPSGLPRMEAFL